MKYLLDTNIISEPMKLNANINVMNKLALDSIFSCTSATVWHELNYGIDRLELNQNKNAKRANELRTYLSLLTEKHFEILPYCKKSAEWLSRERARLNRVGITPTKYDSEIAAVALVNKLTLVTRNTNDFKIYEGLMLENWFD